MALCCRSETGNLSNTSVELWKAQCWETGKRKNHGKVQKVLGLGSGLCKLSSLLTSIPTCCSEVRNFVIAKANSQGKLSSRVVVWAIKLQSSWLPSKQTGNWVFSVLSISSNYLPYPSGWERRSVKWEKNGKGIHLFIETKVLIVPSRHLQGNGQKRGSGSYWRAFEGC